LSDSQPVLWAMKHKETNVKLSRWLLNPGTAIGTFLGILLALTFKNLFKILPVVLAHCFFFLNVVLELI